MFIFVFILSFLNITQISSGTSSTVNEESIKKDFGESIPETYVCKYDKLGYKQYSAPILPGGAPPDTVSINKNDLIQNKEYIEKFLKIHGNVYTTNEIFEKIFNYTKNTIVANVDKLFSLNDNEKKDIVMECPIKIPDNPKNNEFNSLFKKEDKEENIFNIFKQYHQIETIEMSYLYLQKKINNDADIRKNGYKKIPDEFDFNDYKGQTLVVILNLETNEYVFLAKN